jgi:putative membrane protein
VIATTPGRPRFAVAPAEWIGPLAAVGAAGVLAWLCAARPAALPYWAPWEFSWSQFLAAVLGLFWYARGVALTPVAERPVIARQAAFGLGVLLIYAVLLTHFEYMAQHMFFLNRLQHLVMHHAGPFLIALSWPGEALLRGMPAPLRRVVESQPLRRATWVAQQPLFAGAVFVGLIYFWLIPSVHFRAMIDPRLYAVMNWSMVIDGLLFWCLTLDPRPAPRARAGFGPRMIVTVLVMFPQILIGAWVTFSTTSLYPYYDLCGRLYPSIGALLDQHIGGTILWIPSAMMSSIAFMLMLNYVRINEDNQPVAVEDGRPRISSSAWTGR